MMPPTSIDGTDITGATIDGTDVQEITVDGQTVFSAETLPVAYSNLVAWYPFDSATYGGSDADDVTAIIGGSGDDTAYDATVNNAIYEANGGVTDLNGGVNSGSFANDGTNRSITNTSPPSIQMPQSFSLWIEYETENERFDTPCIVQHNTGNVHFDNRDFNTFRMVVFDGSSFNVLEPAFESGIHLHTVALDSSSYDYYIDGIFQGSDTSFNSSIDEFTLLKNDDPNFPRELDGRIDDFRIYDKKLSSTEVDNIYQNTKPVGHTRY